MQSDARTAAPSRGVNTPAAVEIKGSMFTLPVLRLHSTAIDILEQELSQRLAQHLSFFEHAPVVIDLEHLNDEIDFVALVQLLRQRQLVPVGVRQATAQQGAAAIAAGLAVLKGGSNSSVSVPVANVPEQVEAKSETAVAPRALARPTRVVRQPVRSGQQIYAQGGDLILLAPVNAGAEVIADGNIHIYAPLRGRALAGVLGDVEARIFTLSMEAELVAIAGNYQVFEESLPQDVYCKSVQIQLEDTQLRMTPLTTAV